MFELLLSSFQMTSWYLWVLLFIALIIGIMRRFRSNEINDIPLGGGKQPGFLALFLRALGATVYAVIGAMMLTGVIEPEAGMAVFAYIVFAPVFFLVAATLIFTLATFRFWRRLPIFVQDLLIAGSIVTAAVAVAL
jgi:hypothetical protein